MSIDLTKTSGTSPPALYHHTHSLSLPQIMRDGFLKPLNSEAVRTGDAASDAAPEYVHATTNPEGDSTSTLAYVLRNRPDLDHIRIRLPNEFKNYIQPMHINCGGSAPPPVVYKLRTS